MKSDEQAMLRRCTRYGLAVGLGVMMITLALLFLSARPSWAGKPAPTGSDITLAFSTAEIRPQLVERTGSRTLTRWTAPPQTHLLNAVHQGPIWTLVLAPTGAETQRCAYTVTVDLSEDTPRVYTHTHPCADLQEPVQTVSPTLSLLSAPHTSALDNGTLLTPPAYIRVRHDPRNTCRNVPPWQVDVIPFEEYVARVVPAEMPALWPLEALKAQAIASRTYAWHHVLHPYSNYDVSDWVDNQVMCDRRHPRSDLAVEATRGQILVYAGEPIVAFYAAQNGHPTRDDPWGLPYIAPVPDPVSLGATRRGHGWGLSQVGAARWAARGWNAYQILAHYYPGATLSLPPDSPGPVGTLLPPELENMTLGHAYPLFLYATSPRPLRAVTVTARLGDGSPVVVLTRTRPISPFLGVWEPPAAFSGTKPIDIETLVEDISHTVSSLGGARLFRHTTPPTITVTAVTRTVDPRIALDIRAAGESLEGIRVGVSEGWVWEEDAFSWMPRDAGMIVSDPQAVNGRAWQHPQTAGTGILYGPYTHALEEGRSYRAWFRLAAGDVSSPDAIAFLDVVEDTGATLLGLRALRGIEFPAAGVYREFPVDFHLFPRPGDAPRRVEFRVHALAPITLTLDRVLVTTYPDVWDPDQRWSLTHQPGPHLLVVKATDEAGAVSADASLSITLDMPPVPMTFTAHAPSGWITSAIPISWEVRTAVAPPDPDTFAYRYSRDGTSWSSWFPIRVGDVYSRGGTLELPASRLPDGPAVWVQVRGEDAFTYAGASEPLSVSVDLHPPQAWVTATVDVASATADVRWGGEDANGIVGYDVEARPGDAWRRWYTATTATASRWPLAPGDRLVVRVRAHDGAGWVGPWSDPVTVTMPYRIWMPWLRRDRVSGAGTP